MSSMDLRMFRIGVLFVLHCLLTSTNADDSTNKVNKKTSVNHSGSDTIEHQEMGSAVEDVLLPYLRNNLNTVITTEMKKALKKELLNMVFKEIVNDIADDIRNNRVDIKNAVNNEVLESIQDIKEQLKYSVISKAKQDRSSEKAKWGISDTLHEYRTFKEKNQSKISEILKNGHENGIEFKTKKQKHKEIKPSSRDHAILDKPRTTQSNYMENSLRRLSPQRSAENIAFTAYIDHHINHMSDLYTIKFNRVLLNDGDAYNVHTGVFTVPVDGVYLFAVHFLNYGPKTELRIVVDGVNQIDTEVDHALNQFYGVQTGNLAVVFVRNGQSVWVETFHTTDGTIDSSDEFRESTFVGVLLYARSTY